MIVVEDVVGGSEVGGGDVVVDVVGSVDGGGFGVDVVKVLGVGGSEVTVSTGGGVLVGAVVREVVGAGGGS